MSENSEFAQAVLDANLILIGPKPSSMYAMGSKTRARQIMQQAGVPVVPGITESVVDHNQALQIAREIGFPLMLKAAAGGGGRGMRKVDSAESFISAFESAKSEAQNSFGNNAVYIEKFLEQPKHIEVQVFADTQGHVISFAERECSVQRRHQKVIEESPSCFVDENMRSKMGQVARQAAQAVDYVGAGTVEFLVDAHKNFYFMEMNTRLQVEHPVTEMITGLDLVEMQIKIAQGEPLEIRESYVPARGWAVEARICAEDPRQNFIPTPGLIRHFRQPGGLYVRMDSAIYTGCEITTDYDSMIGKLIAWAPRRELAIKRLSRALSELTIKGCMTNAMFLRQLLSYEPFLSGQYDTSLIECFQKESKDWIQEEHKIVAILGAALFNYDREQKMQVRVNTAQTQQQNLSRWQSQGRFVL